MIIITRENGHLKKMVDDHLWVFSWMFPPFLGPVNKWSFPAVTVLRNNASLPGEMQQPKNTLSFYCVYCWLFAFPLSPLILAGKKKKRMLENNLLIAVNSERKRELPVLKRGKKYKYPTTTNSGHKERSNWKQPPFYRLAWTRQPMLA